MDLCFSFSFHRGLEQLSPGCAALKIIYLLEVSGVLKVENVSCGLHKQLPELLEIQCLTCLLQLVFACSYSVRGPE